MNTSVMAAFPPDIVTALLLAAAVALLLVAIACRQMSSRWRFTFCVAAFFGSFFCIGLLLTHIGLLPLGGRPVGLGSGTGTIDITAATLSGTQAASPPREARLADKRATGTSNKTVPPTPAIIENVRLKGTASIRGETAAQPDSGDQLKWVLGFVSVFVAVFASFAVKVTYDAAKDVFAVRNDIQKQFNNFKVGSEQIQRSLRADSLRLRLLMDIQKRIFDGLAYPDDENKRVDGSIFKQLMQICEPWDSVRKINDLILDELEHELDNSSTDRLFRRLRDLSTARPYLLALANEFEPSSPDVPETERDYLRDRVRKAAARLHQQLIMGTTTQ